MKHHEDSQQKLIDICFSLVLTCLSEDMKQLEHWRGKSNDEKADWVRENLRGCGFNVSNRIGCSWGVLE